MAKRMTKKEMKQFLEEIGKYKVPYDEIESRIQKQDKLKGTLCEILVNIRNKKQLMN